MHVDLIKVQIRELQKDLAVNRLELKREQGNITRTLELLHARHEIYMSIAHRQGMLIEVLENCHRFNKVA